MQILQQVQTKNLIYVADGHSIYYKVCLEWLPQVDGLMRNSGQLGIYKMQKNSQEARKPIVSLG